MFRHVGIVVKDLEKQLMFYKDFLGLEIYYDEIESGEFLSFILNSPNSKARIIKLGKNKETIVELLKFSNVHFLNFSKKTLCKQNNITHFALTVGGLDELFLELSEKKVVFVSKPKISIDGKCKVCFCRDFEGNFIELVEKL